MSNGDLCDKPGLEIGASMVSRCLLLVVLAKGQILKTHLKKHILFELKSNIGSSSKAILETSA